MFSGSLVTSASLLPTILGLSTGLLGPKAAFSRPVGYGEVACQATVRDRHQRPIVGLTLRLQAALSGWLRSANGETQPIACSVTEAAVTDCRGTARFRIEAGQVRYDFRDTPDHSRAGIVPRGGWFQGSVDVKMNPSSDGQEMIPLAQGSAAPLLNGPAIQGVFSVPGAAPDYSLQVFEAPDLVVQGFPVWLGDDGRSDRVVVVLGGFDPYRVFNASCLAALLSAAGDPLRRDGTAFLVASFAGSTLSPDMEAPTAARAIRAGAVFSGHPVIVAGVSSGGVVGRWTLVEAEEKGAPLPVCEFLTLDSPNRGAWFNPGLQAMILRYGSGQDRRALDCPGARALLSCRPRNVKWSRIGLRGMGRAVPVGWEEDPRDHDAFYARLEHLNQNRGYPRLCRVVAVAGGSRTGPSGSGDLLHLWLPFGYSWRLSAEGGDHAPGSLLPQCFMDRLAVRMPLGIAGADMLSTPTFVPTESALDAGPGERPSFVDYYVEPEGLPSHGHEWVSRGEADFVVKEILRHGSGPAGPDAAGMCPVSPFDAPIPLTPR